MWKRNEIKSKPLYKKHPKKYQDIRKACIKRMADKSYVTVQLMEERRKFKTKRHEHAYIATHHNYLCRRVKKSAKEDKEKYIAELRQ